MFVALAERGGEVAPRSSMKRRALVRNVSVPGTKRWSAIACSHRLLGNSSPAKSATLGTSRQA